MKLDPTNILATSVVSLGLILSGASAVLAGTVTGGTLLSGVDASQLESWLGVNDKTFDHIWSGDAGVASATSFHNSVDGAGPTVSIYDVTIWDGSRALIGGYTGLDWGGSGWQTDNSAFIFNLTTGEAQFTQETDHSIFSHSNYFATFGAGSDLFGGYGTLATCNGGSSTFCDGYTESITYDLSQGQISIAGDSGKYSGNSGHYYKHVVVNSLEVYTSAPALAAVPLPTSGVLLITALGWLAAMRRRKRQS